ncbi:hypothetical protein PUN28_012487 [Cardiocondyla obscurior]|uniref:Uncharacterized protein n=1 Tax=Cardiocondyla obscurior TaxID=286306 RepID=A0AAW2FBV2_9HYME
MRSCAERDAAVFRFQSSIALLSHYIETWASKCRRGPLSSPSQSRFPLDTRNTRKNLAGNARKVRGAVGTLCPRSEHADPTRNIINSRLPDDRTR